MKMVGKKFLFIIFPRIHTVEKAFYKKVDVLLGMKERI